MKNMNTAQCLITLFLIFANSFLAHADYLPNQDTEIIGKKLWVYYDKESCRDGFKIYPSRSTNDALIFSTPIEVVVSELNKTPLNWYAGAWYDLTINNTSITKGHIVYDEINANHGYTKNLYYAELASADLVLLENACISNISPKDKLVLQNKAHEVQLEQEKVIQAQDAERKIERDRLKSVEDQHKALERQAAVEAESQRKQNEETELTRLDKERQAKMLKDAPEGIRALSEDEFCDYYGDFLRGNDLAGFGTADELSLVMKKEAQRRKVRVKEALIKQRKIQLGISTCELYASWGEADSKNRSVGSYGVHIQHVYGSGVYVYSQNGKVTSWQD